MVILFEVRCVGGLQMIENERYEKVIAGGSGARQFLEFIQTNPGSAMTLQIQMVYW